MLIDVFFTLQSYDKDLRMEIDYHKEKMDNITISGKVFLSLQQTNFANLHVKNQKRFFR